MRPMNFYNDIDENACAWTRELVRAGLIPDGIVSSASIADIKAHELTEFTQAHFFCGISGWPLAFRIAGIGDDERADSGSAPCQPFSGTGKQVGFADPRHLWPAFRRVIGKRQPATVYGEQVASGLGREWLARVFSDLAFMGYAGSGADLCSAGVGSPNIRQRLYWVGDAYRSTGDQRGSIGGRSDYRGGEESRTGSGGTSFAVRLGHSRYPRPEGRIIRWDGGYERAVGSPSLGMWSNCELIHCRDQKLRRIESGSFPLAHEIPSRVGPLLTELRKLGRSSIALARANRNIRLKGYGNAINPWVAARFIAAHRSARHGTGLAPAIKTPVMEID